jgi:hypothetical protein
MFSIIIDGFCGNVCRLFRFVALYHMIHNGGAKKSSWFVIQIIYKLSATKREDSVFIRRVVSAASKEASLPKYQVLTHPMIMI